MSADVTASAATVDGAHTTASYEKCEDICIGNMPEPKTARQKEKLLFPYITFVSTFRVKFWVETWNSLIKTINGFIFVF